MDQADRILLLPACNPEEPSYHRRELPGGVEPGETLVQAAIRELTEETGIVLAELGPCGWIREIRFRYHNRDYHNRDYHYRDHASHTYGRGAGKPAQSAVVEPP